VSVDVHPWFRPEMKTRYALVFLLLAAVIVVAQSTVEEQRQQLYETRAQLENVERSLADLRSERNAAQNRVMEDQDKLGLIRRLNAEIDAAQQEKQATLDRIRRAMYNIYEQIENQKQDLAQRLVALYKYGRLFDLELLLSTKTMPEVYRKLYYMRMIAEADNNRVNELLKLQADLGAQASHFKYAAASLLDLQKEYEARQQKLQSDQEFRSQSIRTLGKEEADKTALAERLAAAAEDIERLLRQLESQPKGSQPVITGTFALKPMGGLPWPVSGSVQTGFGDQTNAAYGTQTRNNGLVIAAKTGSPVSAVAKGRVCYAEEFLTYGNLVIVDHGSGTFSLYGNLQDIAVGVDEVVTEGTLLGHANEMVYFELRKANGPVNPLDYLR
jgi:septal ring factor EnvC (AmiA/AmiB activator)